MDTDELDSIILECVPDGGVAIGNIKLREAVETVISGKNAEITDEDFEATRNRLIQQGKLIKGKGRGGSIRRAEPEDNFELESRPATPKKKTTRKKASKKKASKKKAARKKGTDTEVISYRHTDKRKNNPEVGMVNEATDPDEHTDRWCYDPHIDPALQFDHGRAQVEKLIDDALESGNEDTMRAALEELKQHSSPYLNWAGKAERTSFEVDTVSLHVHERIDPASILAAVSKKMKDANGQSVDAPRQDDWLTAPFENLPLRDAVDFYQHDKGWSNRLIAGDALLVMNSLLQKESMAGQVQMIYIDPPYGIKYGSNFQPFTNKKPTSRTDKDEDLTQEPEMIKAFRDTWELGIHSYLSYLRDRLLLSKELLNERGSIFIQISDENHHLIRNLLEEIFGIDNVIVSIPVKKKGSQKGGLIDPVNDYLVWCAKDRSKVKYRQLFYGRQSDEETSADFSNIDLGNGIVTTISKLEKNDKVKPGVYKRDLSTLKEKYPLSKLFKSENSTGGNPGQSQAVKFKYRDKEFDPGISKGLGWKASATVVNEMSGMERLAVSGRLHIGKSQLGLRRYPDDFGLKSISNWWDGLGGAPDPIYVVQTNERIIDRCILMTTDPGDLVLDPTCGSGTTAKCSERLARRWITMDTSRVAVTLAKQRLLTAGFDYFKLKYPHEGIKSGFVNKLVPHITATGIANNSEIDAIYESFHPDIESALNELNNDLGVKLKEWEVPFDFQDTWSESARKSFDKLHTARQTMQKKMDESIAAHADQETLYDQPEIDKSKLRIAGPFSVEAVPFATVLSLEEHAQPNEADVSVARSGESARQHQWRDELLKTGIIGKGGDKLTFAELETLPDTKFLHASGHLDSGERVVVSFGPEHAALEQRQVEHALSEAADLFPRPKMIVFCAFTFDPEAAKDIDQLKGIIALKAQMNTDLLTEDLKSKRSSNQSFWLMGQPEVEVRKTSEGQFEVEVHGFDYFDTRKGELVSGGPGKIAMWLLDTDYDERSLFPRQVFFPMAGKKDGWNKLRKTIRAELDESLLQAYHGTVSLPFEAGDNQKVAVKVIDDRGIESLKIIPLDV